MSPGIAVAVVPEEYYRKANGLQFKASFRRREDAVRYAEQHSCRLVIACDAESRYDVLCAPGSNPGPKVNFELIVDRGEWVAAPRLAPPDGELSRSSTESAPDAAWTTRKIARIFMYSWLGAWMAASPAS
ncbi:MAG: hypothetical protein EPN47_07405 [Acidobacteria bacterium]|nr:MAG: hypothetical protein EPN47_07405 [Acidobacteriota bacterium]